MFGSRALLATALPRAGIKSWPSETSLQISSPGDTTARVKVHHPVPMVEIFSLNAQPWHAVLLLLQFPIRVSFQHSDSRQSASLQAAVQCLLPTSHRGNLNTAQTIRPCPALHSMETGAHRIGFRRQGANRWEVK